MQEPIDRSLEDPPAEGRPTNRLPRVWLVLGDKLGDNAQAEIVAEHLGWPLERKMLKFKPRFVEGKPRFRPSLHHIDLESSARLEPPWPDLVITAGRRPAMAAVWLRRQSGDRAKVVMVGRPRGGPATFDLVVAPPQFRVPDDERVVPLALPLMRPDRARIEAGREEWSPRFADLPRPLTAVLVGGKTRPFRVDAAAMAELVAGVRKATETSAEGPGTLYFTTSRRTPEPAVRALEAALPANARLHAWRPDAPENPYAGLLALADRFVVTGDSVSMMVEVARLGRPLAIFAPPVRMAPLADLARALGLAGWGPGAPVNADRAAALNRLFFSSRDLTAVQRALVERGLAVWLGAPFPTGRSGAPDDLDKVVRRIHGLFGAA
ncbi:MAG: ELM1/GtrOC1 family putative glycosyltransferase [Kiloniellales bacterium]|nr:ELM1/GtrOC1 family putative glycosyltransferase [Kiloniellales bacterium]